MSTKILVQCPGELVNRWGNLQTLLKDPSLPLNSHHLRPFDEAMEIPLRRQSTSDPELLRPLFKERIHNLLLQHITSPKLLRSPKPNTKNATRSKYTVFFFAATGALPPLFGACNNTNSNLKTK